MNRNETPGLEDTVILGTPKVRVFGPLTIQYDLVIALKNAGYVVAPTGKRTIALPSPHQDNQEPRT